MPNDITAQPVRLVAGCKINLGLRITGVRSDGYHLIDSVFMPIPTPCDEILIEKGTAPGMTVLCDVEGIDCKRNTLTKAYALFAGKTGFSPSLKVRLDKGIPWGAGLGGGSSDGAAILRYLNGICPTPLSEDALADIAAGVGADVPFFLATGPMRVTGIGDELAPCTPDLPGAELVLVTPDIQISTPWAYRAYDEAQESLTMQQNADKDSSLFCVPNSAFVNDLEPVVFARYPEIAQIRAWLVASGAAAAAMSGSGSSVYGIFTDREDAARAASTVGGTWPVHHMRLNTGV